LLFCSSPSLRRSSLLPFKPFVTFTPRRLIPVSFLGGRLPPFFPVAPHKYSSVFFAQACHSYLLLSVQPPKADSLIPQPSSLIGPHKTNVSQNPPHGGRTLDFSPSSLLFHRPPSDFVYGFNRSSSAPPTRISLEFDEGHSGNSLYGPPLAPYRL